MSDRALVVFVKHPRPGAVKTRLVPALGEEPTAALYRALAEAVLVATTPRADEYERLVFFDPPDAAKEMRAWLPGLRLLPQSGSDLGSRMAAAFARAFERGARRVAIVGTDVPAVGRGVVLEALDGLDDAEVVVGPAEDGGYYLLGLREPRPDLFEGIAWGTPAVRAQMLERASRQGLVVSQLTVRRDIDTPEDLRAEWPRLRSLLADHPELCRRIESLLTRGAG